MFCCRCGLTCARSSLGIHITDLHDLGDKPTSIDSELCCRKNFRKFLPWAEPEPVNGGVSCSQPAGKVSSCVQNLLFILSVTRSTRLGRWFLSAATRIRLYNSMTQQWRRSVLKSRASRSVSWSHQTVSDYTVRQRFPNTQQSRFWTACSCLKKVVLPSIFDTHLSSFIIFVA